MRHARSLHARVAAAGLLVLVVLLTSACEAVLSIDIAVDRDGAGRLAIALGADADLLTQAEAAGSDPLGDLAALGDSLEGEGWRTTDAREGDGSRTVTLAAPFASPAEFDALAALLGEALAAPELTPFEDLRLLLTDDEVRLTGVAGLMPTAEVASLGLTPEEAVALVEARDALRYDISVALPGTVLETTADEGLGDGMRTGDGGGAGDGPIGPLTWRIAPGEQVTILAVSERPSGSWLILAGSGALGGLLALGLLGALRRGRSPASRAAVSGAPPRRDRGTGGSGEARDGTGAGEASSSWGPLDS